jgi:flagellar biogenesis protein FliO
MQKETTREVAAGELPLNNFASDLVRTIRQFFGKIAIKRKIRTLRLQETLAFGDRRFLAVVEWENKTLLVGVTPQSITLLDKTPEPPVVGENTPLRSNA